MEQAKEIEERVELAYLVNSANFGFKPVMLKEYYLYRKEENILTLTLISPEEWNGSCPYGEFICSVRQLGDSTWEKVNIAESSQFEQTVEKK